MKRLVFIILILLAASSTAFAKWAPSDSYRKQVIDLIFHQKDIDALRAKLKASLKRGLDPDFSIYSSGSENIMITVMKEFNKQKLKVKEMAALLLKHGANIEWYEPTEGYTPLMMAARTCNVPTVNYLIEQGADIHKRITVMGHYESVLKSSMGCLEVADILVGMGVDLTEGERCDLWQDLFTDWYNEEEFAGYHQTVFRWFHNQPSVDSYQCCMIKAGSSSLFKRQCQNIWTDFEFIPLDELFEEDDW